MSKLIYKCMTKGTYKENGELRYSQNWVTAKRGFFKVFSDKVTLGQWEFYKGEMKNIILYNTTQMFIPVKVLRFEYDEKIYHFGFNPWADPLRYMDMEYTIENVKIKYSMLSLAMRMLMLISGIIYIMKLLKK